MRVNKLWAFALVVVLLGLLSYRVIEIFEFGKELNYHDFEECVLVPGITGAEDITRYSDSIILTSSDDRLTLWDIPTTRNGGPSNTEQGAIYAVVLPPNESPQNTQIFKLALEGFPQSVAFHPHGIYLFNQSLLFVINHAYAQGGERVDVFSVTPSKTADELNPPLKLVYEYTLGEKFLTEVSYGCANDILVVAPGKFYITQYQPFPDSKESGRDGFMYKLKGMFAVLSKSDWTYVRYCEYSTDASAGTNREITCQISGKGVSLNGINKNQKGDLIFVADPIVRQLKVFKRDRNDNTLSVLSSVPTPYAVDNIELDGESGRIMLSAIGSVSRHFKHVSTRVSGKESSNPGGAQELLVHGTTFKVQDLLLQDGDLLSSISAACKFGSRLVLGSWEDNGVLICPLVE